MDVVRLPRRSPVASIWKIALWLVGLAALGIAAYLTLPALVAHRGERETVVSHDALVIDTVTRGTLERAVTASGVLQPDRVYVVASAAEGTVTDVPVRAGAHVEAGTVVAHLDNPDLRVAVADAAAQLDAASAELTSVRQEATASQLDARAALRTARAEEKEAQVLAASYKDLYAQGLIGSLQYQSAAIKSGETHDLTAIAGSKISVGSADADAKIAASRARVDQLRAALEAKRAQLETLVIVAGAAGTLQSVAVDPGQRVSVGAEFARIAADHDLKAVLAIPESDVRGIATGMPVRLAASNAGTVDGIVTRFAPAAENGTVAVDVTLARVPTAWRPQQSLTGTVVLGRAERALSLVRPAGATDGTHLSLYRLDAAGTHAFRAAVAIGAGTDERVRILSGLAAGDRVIVSDTSSYDAPALRIQE